MLTDRGRTLLERWIYVLVKVGEDFLLPYTPERWRAVTGDDMLLRPRMKRIATTK